MDEQEIIASQDFSEPEPDYSEPTEPEITEPQPSEPEQELEQELQTDWGITEDGEVNFSDEYLGEAEKSLFPNKSGEDLESKESKRSEQQEEPKYYTPEELANTPYEQWDINRLNGDIKNFVPIVQQQIAQRQAQAQAAQRAQADQLSNYIQAPVQYTPKELAEAAQKLAIERLGLTSPEDFDEYEGEHRAALNLAMQELSSQRQMEVANFQRASSEYQQLQQFNRQLASQPDFKEFYSWYESQLKENNLTPQQVDTAFWNHGSSTGRFMEIAGIMGNWYREFQQTKSRPRARAATPPVLESTRGKSFDGTGSVNLREFGEMDTDQQARALIKMGIVKEFM